MGSVSRWLVGFGLGAAAMYFLDPVWGRRRRHLVVDRTRSLGRRSRDFSAKAVRDGRQRVRGAWMGFARRFRFEEVSDEVLVERVRARLGRAVSHPHAIAVEAREGAVALSGPILAHEEERLIACVWRVPGVHAVESFLEPHPSAGNVPALQGGPLRQERRTGVPWAPSLRLAAAMGGAVLLGYGLAHGRARGLAAGGFGAGLLGRSLTNRPVRKILGPERAPRRERGVVASTGRELEESLQPGLA